MQNCRVKKAPLMKTIFFLTTFLFSYSAFAQLPLDSLGWTIFTPHPDNRILYVSSLDGDDAMAQVYRANDFPDPFNPPASMMSFEDIETAKSHMRHEHGDWILFKKGDEFYDVIGRHRVSGHSSSYPTLYGSYGSSTERPVFLSGAQTVIGCYAGNGTPDSVSNYAIIGLEMYQHSRDPEHHGYIAGSGGGAILRILREGRNILVEDCYSRFGQLTIQRPNSAQGPISNVKIRRCVVVDNYSTNSHAQGLFCSGIDTLLIEENVFDHNGWHDTITGAEQTVFNHNMYIQYTNTLATATVRNNIIARASSHGLQLRSGGLMENNLFVRDPLPFFIGINRNQTGNIVTMKHGKAIGNVCLESNDIGTAPRGFAMELLNLDSVLAYNNLFTTDSSSDYNSDPIRITQDTVRNAVIEHNTIYNWGDETPGGSSVFSFVDHAENNIIRENLIQQHDLAVRMIRYDVPYASGSFLLEDNQYYSLRNPTQMFQIDNLNYDLPSWQSLTGDNSVESLVTFDDPNRNLSSYQASLGETATFEAFMEEARKQSKDNWQEVYTAQAVNDYLRAGFCWESARPHAAFTYTANGPTVDFMDSSFVDNVGLEYGTTYWEWDFGDGSSVSNAPNSSHVYAADGSYSVRLIVGNACRTDTLVHSVMVSTVVDVLLEVDGLQLLSNPTDSIFEITGLLSNYTIQILNENSTVYQTLPNTGSYLEIDISALPPSFYFFFIENDTNHLVSIQQILKE